MCLFLIIQYERAFKTKQQNHTYHVIVKFDMTPLYKQNTTKSNFTQTYQTQGNHIATVLFYSML